MLMLLKVQLLCPLLLGLYINDLAEVCPPTVTYEIYIDDNIINIRSYYGLISTCLKQASVVVKML